MLLKTSNIKNAWAGAIFHDTNENYVVAVAAYHETSEPIKTKMKGRTKNNVRLARRRVRKR